MKINYKKYFIKSLKGILYGLAVIVLNLICSYVLFGEEVYIYEVSQYFNINNLITKCVFSIILFIIFLFIISYDEKLEEKRKEISLKKYFIKKIILLIFILIYVFIMIFIFNKFIRDKYFAINFVVIVNLLSLIYVIVTFLYNSILQIKINKKLKEINQI